MKNKLIFYNCIFLNIIVIIILGIKTYNIYTISKEECIEIIEKSFQIAIKEEAQKRLIDNNIPYVHYNNYGEEEKTEDAMLISETDTIKIKRTKDYEAQTEEEKRIMFLQTILVWENFIIQLDDLNFIWQNKLKEKYLYIQTGIKYRNRDFSETLYTSTDSLFFQTSNKISEYRTGVINEISLYGFYKISPYSIIKYSKANFIFYAWINSIIILILIFISKKMKKLNIKITPFSDIRLTNSNINLKLSVLYIYLIINIICILFLLNHSYKFYQTYKEKCIENIALEFLPAIIDETNKRLIDSDLKYMDINFPEKEKPKDATFTSENDTIYIKRTEEYESQTLNEKRNMFFQSVLVWEEFFLNPATLDSIWNHKLREIHIYIPTGVKYRHRDFADTKYSKKDSTFFSISKKINVYKTGLLKDISLQGHYYLPIKSILIYGQKDFMKLGWIGSFLIISLIGTYFGIIRVSRFRLTPLIPPPTDPEVLTIKKATIYPLNEYIELDVERGLLTTDDGREVKLKYHMVQLFEELLLSPYFHAFDTDIRLRIWFQEDEPSNVLTQLISRTREAVKPIKEIEIRNIRKRGYQLIIHPKGEKWDQVPERNHQQKTLTFD